VLRYARPFLGLLGGQDEILNPNGYARDQNGIVRFDFNGFWIDEERTLIYFSGWQVTRT